MLFSTLNRSRSSPTSSSLCLLCLCALSLQLVPWGQQCAAAVVCSEGRLKEPLHERDAADTAPAGGRWCQVQVRRPQSCHARGSFAGDQRGAECQLWVLNGGNRGLAVCPTGLWGQTALKSRKWNGAKNCKRPYQKKKPKKKKRKHLPQNLWLDRRFNSFGFSSFTVANSTFCIGLAKRTIYLKWRTVSSANI